MTPRYIVGRSRSVNEQFACDGQVEDFWRRSRALSISWLALLCNSHPPLNCTRRRRRHRRLNPHLPSHSRFLARSLTPVRVRVRPHLAHSSTRSFRQRPSKTPSSHCTALQSTLKCRSTAMSPSPGYPCCEFPDLKPKL